MKVLNELKARKKYSKFRSTNTQRPTKHLENSERRTARDYLPPQHRCFKIFLWQRVIFTFLGINSTQTYRNPEDWPWVFSKKKHLKALLAIITKERSQRFRISQMLVEVLFQYFRDLLKTEWRTRRYQASQPTDSPVKHWKNNFTTSAAQEHLNSTIRIHCVHQVVWMPTTASKFGGDHNYTCLSLVTFGTILNRNVPNIYLLLKVYHIYFRLPSILYP